jgi:putative transposase
MLRERFGVSERRACKVVRLNRSTQLLDPPPVTDEEAELREFLRQFSATAVGVASRRQTGPS